MTRPLISYDDIVTPEPAAPSIGPRVPSSKPPPKRRKRSHQKLRQKRGDQATQRQHWDDPRVLSYQEENDEEEGRELTVEEIWDDSALIQAWDAATEEYEALNGPDKSWKHSPVKKSPLWYNVPPLPSNKKPAVQTLPLETAENVDAPIGEDEQEDEDSHPIDFDTFVPAHDPSLDLPLPPQPPLVPGPDYSGHYLPEPLGSLVSVDEAFNRALGAMYWGGYWTAVYHCQKNASRKRPAEVEDKEMEVELEQSEASEMIHDEEEDLEYLPTQR